MSDHTGQQMGNYRLVRLLGKGGFAEVYLGEHIHLGTPAAIKLLTSKLSAEEESHFQEEARTIAWLRHPNIVRVLEYGVQEGLPYLVMDYAPNGTLRQFFAKGGKYPPLMILPYVQQVAAALQFAHDRKLIHRDVKPENMLLGEQREVLLSDFGIAVVAQSSRHQDVQEVVGTLAYMAPEQIQAHPRPASDQYSLGVVIYEWLTGSRPFAGSMSEILAKQISALPPPIRDQIPQVSTDLEQIVLTALAKDPKDRFASIRAFATAFEQAALAQGTSAIPAPPIPGPPTPGIGSANNVISTPSTPSTPANSSPGSNWPSFYDPAGPASTPSSPPYYASPGPAPNVNSAPNVVPSAPADAAAWVISSPGSSFDPSGPHASAPAPSAQNELSLLDAPTLMGTFLPPTATPQPAQPNAPAAGGWPAPPQVSGPPPAWQNPQQVSGPPPAWPAPPQMTPAAGPVNTGPTFFAPPEPPQTGSTLLASQPIGSGAPPVISAPPIPTASPKGQGISRRKVLIAGAAGIAGLAVAGGGVTWFVLSNDKTTLQAPSATPTVPPILPLYVFRGHVGTVYNAAWSIDGSRIATAGDDHTVQIWDALTGANVVAYKGHTAAVRAVSFSPDKLYLASASDDKTIQIANLATNKETFVYTRHTDAVLTTAWAPVGTDVASASLDHTLRVWSTLSNVTLPFKQIFSGSIYATWVAWSLDGKFLASASTDGYVRTWDGVSGSRHTKYGPQNGSINGVSWSPDGTRIVSGGTDRAVRIWDAESAKTYASIPTGTSSVRSVAWSPNGASIAAATSAAVYIVDAKTFKITHTFSGHKDAVLSVAWSPDSQYVVSAGEDGTAQVWQPPAAT